MKVLRVSLSCPPPQKKKLGGFDVSIVALESHDLHVIFSGDVLRIS